MRYFLLMLYVICNLFLYILNFEVFNSEVRLDFGFKILTTMPIILVQVLGLLFVVIFFFVEKFKEIRNSIQIQTLETKINLLMKDLEIKDLKESMPAVENPEINNTTTEL